jgi:DNA-binding transcriptional regulator GbsR (MarR family)
LQSRDTTSAPPPSVEGVFERECVALFAGYLHVLGIPKSIGAIYGLLFASPVPLCFSQIVEKFCASKGSVSQGLAFLRQIGAVKEIRVPGDRREFFEPELGLRRLASGLIREKIEPLARNGRSSLAGLKNSLAAVIPSQNKFQMARIRQLETWHSQLRLVIPAVQAVLAISRK